MTKIEEETLDYLMEVRLPHAIQTLREFANLCDYHPNISIGVLIVIFERLILNCSLLIISLMDDKKIIKGTDVIDILANEINKLKEQSDYSKNLKFN